jgi:hypothetical protein
MTPALTVTAAKKVMQAANSRMVLGLVKVATCGTVPAR